MVYTKNILSPPAVFCESYILLIVLMYINSALLGWNIDICNEAIRIVGIGCTLFCIAFFVSDSFLKYYFGYSDNSYNSYESDDIFPDAGVFYLFTLVSFIIMALYVYYFIKQVGLVSSLSDLNRIMNLRKIENYNSTSLDRLFPFWLTLLAKFNKMFAYASAYYLINLVQFQRTHLFRYILPIILYIPIVLLSGSRWNIIIVFISMLFMWYEMKRKNNNTNIRVYITMAVMAIIVCVFFSLSRTIVGRQTQGGLLRYVSFYFGVSLQNLSLFIKDPIEKSYIWGKETFYSIHRFLSQLGIDKSFYTIHLEFRYKDGINLGNTYTGFREYYYDFGWAGVIILTLILGLFFGVKYYKNQYTQESKIKGLRLIWYTQMLSLLMMHSFSEGFYRSYLSFDYFVSYIVAYFILFCLQYVTVKYGNKQNVHNR